MDTQEKTRDRTVAKRSFTPQLVQPFNQLRNEVDYLINRFPFRLPTMEFGGFATAPTLDRTETEGGFMIPKSAKAAQNIRKISIRNAG